MSPLREHRPVVVGADRSERAPLGSVSRTVPHHAPCRAAAIHPGAERNAT
jgi:hypothetical protein